LCLLIVLVPVVESLRAIVLVGIVLVCTLVLDVVRVVQLLGPLFGMTTSLDFVILVHSLGLSKFVDLATYEASEKFLGELVRDGLAFLALVVLVELEAFEGGSTCDKLMRELGLVVVALVTLIVPLAIDLLMSVLGFVPAEHVGWL